MAELLVQAPDQPPRRVPLTRPEMRLGRSADCEIVIDDPGVSRVHARLVKEGGGWAIEDLESRNGTFVNEAPVRRARLEPGDRARLGRDVVLELAEDAGGVARPRRGGERAGARPSARSQAGGRALARGFLRRVELELRPAGSLSGEPGQLVPGSVATVGRDPAAQIRLEHESISRLHARLEREGDALLVTDLKSRNGTLVNGEPARHARLDPGGVVQFGDLPFELVRRERLAVRRLLAAAAVLVAVVLAVWGIFAAGDWINERQAARQMEERLHEQALASVRKGVAAARAGEADFARSYLLYAADLLLLSDRAPAGASLERPAELFRAIALELPPAERDFDFAQALDPRTVELAQQRLEQLSTHDYVAHQVKRIAIELGQDEDVPQGFVDTVWAFVSACSEQPAWFQGILDRSPRYQPMLSRMVAEARLPEAFCYVAWIESRLDPNATSPAGARGLWQLMPDKAREVDLVVDPPRAVDERTDPVKATRAATQFIGNLIRTFGREQFMCALAAYNLGDAGMRNAMRKIPDPMMPSSQKYWYLVRDRLLPDETNGYVARIFAARIMAEEPARFGFRAPGAGS